MTFGGYYVGDFQIIPPQSERYKADLARLLQALMMAARSMGLDHGKWLLSMARSEWLAIPMAPETGPSNGLPTPEAVLAALSQFLLGIDDSTSDGWFQDPPRENLELIAKRANAVMAHGMGYVRKQVLSHLGVKAGTESRDLAMRKAGANDASHSAVALDALIPRGKNETILAIELAAIDAARPVIPIPTGEELLASLPTGRLADDIKAQIQTGKLALNKADARYQRIRRAKPRIEKARAQARKAKLKDAAPSSQSVIGERLLAANAKGPVKHPGLGDRGLTYRPANMSFDESKPTPKRRPRSSDPHYEDEV